jgi:hypothetical protein
MAQAWISRRRVLQGGAAAGLLLAVPALPTPAVAQRPELALRTDTLAVSGSRVANPAPGHDHDLSVASLGHVGLPVVEVAPFQMVAVSWRGGPTGGASLRVRERNGWGPWQALHFDPSEAPDDADLDVRFSAPLWVGWADAVEVVVPDGVGEVALHRVVEEERTVALLDTAQAGARPLVQPRSAWGARSFKGNPAYASHIRMAIVHHSVTANGYTAAQVPGMIAGIQRFHQDGRGWNDIAYNFVVDRFGRLWEGRAGGVDRPVIGGHTLGCNTATIGICYLGTANASAPIPDVALASITALLRWKFNQVHLVAPDRTTSYTPASSGRYPAGRPVSVNTVVGHATMGVTECPGAAQMARINASVLAPLTTPSDVRNVDTAPGGGFWLTTSDGQAFPRSGAPFHGSMSGMGLNAPMIATAPTATGKGYWQLAADGGIFSFGDATFFGSTGGMRLNRPVVGMSTTATGRGYWLVASDGGIFSFGDATFYGSTGGMRLNQPVVGMVRTPSGRGYWLFASDGGIFAFGDAGFFGSAGGERLPSPAVSVAAHPAGTGYWMALANGTVRAYRVPHLGQASVPSNDPVVGIAATRSGGGYWLATRSGTVHRFGDAT